MDEATRGTPGEPGKVEPIRLGTPEMFEARKILLEACFDVKTDTLKLQTSNQFEAAKLLLRIARNKGINIKGMLLKRKVSRLKK